MSISNKALLVSLSISQWGAKRIDKRATSTVEMTHGTQYRVGNYTKKLLPRAKELDEVQRLSGAMRVFFYKQTLPWANEGIRILKSTNYMDFTAAFRSKNAELSNAIDDLVRRYPELKKLSKVELGDLWEESEYPSPETLRKSFSCEIHFMPVPDVDDFRVEITDSEKKAFLESMQTVESEALKECWTRLNEVVSKAVDKLSDPSAVFRDSLIENIQELCQLLPKLNVTDDSTLEGTRLALEKAVASINPAVCRENNTARFDAAKTLGDLLTGFSL